MKNQFETGATNHRVNDLILWIENDKESFALIEKVFQAHQTHEIMNLNVYAFNSSVNEAINKYKKQFPTSHYHILGITPEETADLKKYFFDAYTDWSNENSYLSSVDVIFEDAEHNYRTSMSKKTTEKDAKEYFIGRSFNVGSYPNEIFAKPINIKFHAPTYTV